MTSPNVNTLVQEGEMAGNLIASILGAGKLSIVTDAARTAVKATVTQLENGVDHLHTKLDNVLASNPIVVQAVPAAKQILTTLGVELPSEDQVFTEVKQAIADLGAAATPPAAATA